MFRTDDPIADFYAHESELERALKKLPVCADCCEPVQDEHFFLINDEVICPDCLINGYRKNTEDFVS